MDSRIGIIRTFTGVDFNVFKPKPEDMCIEDIAHALSNQCRFGGHTVRFYSVAEHCIKCAEMIDSEHALAALLHDASEAYLVDIPSPLKVAMPEYIENEAEVMRVISEKFGFEWPLNNMVKQVDRAMLGLEWNNLMVASKWITMPSEYARARFLEMFDELTSK
jgi:hypothetical protein